MIFANKPQNSQSKKKQCFIDDYEDLVVVADFAFLLNWFGTILRALRGQSGLEKGLFEKSYYLLLLGNLSEHPTY
ncbi:hypothetical protein OAJ77_06315 [Rhodospirillales bacterium]|nr:hypothetical protein [Rhodospirillales bacterium]